MSWSISSIFKQKFTLSKCASQPKIAEKSLKTHFFRVQGRSRSSMLVPPECSSAVLVMMRSKSVSICNHSRARLVDSSRNRTFSRGYPNLMRSYGGRKGGKGREGQPLRSKNTGDGVARPLARHSTSSSSSHSTHIYTDHRAV